MNDFERDKQFAANARNAAFWGEVYGKAFPSMVSHYLNMRDNPAQRAGVDRVIVLKSTHTLRIDEKVRREDYGDIALEYVSNDRTGAPGWIEKDLTIDYLAYGVLPRRIAYLFPWEMLRRAWLKFGQEWIDRAKREELGFKLVRARNRHYMTLSVAVPLEVVRRKVNSASVIQLDELSEQPLEARQEILPW